MKKMDILIKDLKELLEKHDFEMWANNNEGITIVCDDESIYMHNICKKWRVDE